MTRRFFVRTYGCQMNEHDSERIAGVLAADGMEPTDDLAQADVVVFNTCCIRENADNKFYGHLGDMKALKAERPDLQIAVGGCLAQKDRDAVRERAPFVDVVFGTHNLAHASDLLRTARRDGPIVEILDEHEAYPSALPARRDADHSAWVTIQIGCDNTCAFCIVPSVRGKEVSRRTGDIVSEVTDLARDGVVEITLLGQNVNSYGRDLGAGQFRPQFADLLRGTRRRRRHRAHPVHLAAPQGPAAGDDRGDGRMRARVRAPPPSPAVRQRSHARVDAPRLHRRSLPRTAARGARRDPRPRGHDRHHRRVPGRDRSRLRAYARSRRRGGLRRRVHLRVLAPAGHRGGDDDRRVRRAGGRPGTDGAPDGSRRGSRAAQARRPGRPNRGTARRRRVEAGREHVVGAHPSEQARALRARRDHCARRARRGRGSPAPPPTGCAATCSGG